MSLPVALQLYSVRDQLAKDFKGTIEKVKAMGYQGVELAGLPEGYTPAEVKKIIEDCGLEVISSHVPFPEMMENPEKVICDYKTIGCRYIVIPWLDKDEAFSAKNFDKNIERIAAFGKRAKENGFTLLYHNHNFEFEKQDGEYILDKLYRLIEPDYLQTELDTCWVAVGGVNPADYVRKYTGRAPIVHLKDYSGSGTKGLFGLIGKDGEEEKADGDFRFQPIGRGVQDWKEILKASEEAGAEWVVVEQDESPDMPTLEAARISRDYLLSLGY